LSNVHFLGPRPHKDLPSLLGRLDVGLMPFVVNDFSRPLVPLKLYEYMAAGLPVVSTKLPNLAPYRSLIRLSAQDVDSFGVAITETLALDRADQAQKLRAAAQKYTWTKINEEYVVPVLRDVFGF
jgi:glycosyltransferase involved in cell wall biosynthesis